MAQEYLLRSVLENSVTKVLDALARGGEMNALDASGWSPLTRASMNGLDEMVLFLLINGADVELPYLSGESWSNLTPPLVCAAMTSHTNIIRLLVIAGVSVDNCAAKVSALMTALCHFRIDESVVRTLFEAGASVHTTTESNWSVLMYAVIGKDVALVEDVLARGAAVNTCTDDGETALSLASKCRHASMDIVKLLLKYGAKDDNRGRGGATALVWAVSKNNTELLSILLRNDRETCHSSLNMSDGYGQTPLHIAVVRRLCPTVVPTLLSHATIDTTAKNRDGLDCLMLARAKNRHVKGKLISDHRRNKELAQLLAIGHGLAARELPVLLLVEIYELLIVFEGERVSLFDCWEVLKIVKRRGGNN